MYDALIEVASPKYSAPDGVIMEEFFAHYASCNPGSPTCRPADITHTGPLYIESESDDSQFET